MHPAGSWRPPHQIQFILVEIKENGVADDKTIVTAGDKLFRLIDFEVLERINGEIGKQFQSVRPFDVQVGHVVGLIKKSAGFTPRALFIPPVGKFGPDNRKRIWPDLRISQHPDRIAGGV